MSQILNFAAERNRASEVALQPGVAIERPGAPARELTQWPAAQRAKHGVRLMATGADQHCHAIKQPKP